MRKFNKPEPQTPINFQIKYEQLRVVDETGQLGVMTKSQALNIAQSRGLDLIVITESANPPVAKILDANKYLYEQKLREKEQAKKQRESRIEVKEIQFRPGIGDHDFETKLKNKILFENLNKKLSLKNKGEDLLDEGNIKEQ